MSGHGVSVDKLDATEFYYTTIGQLTARHPRSPDKCAIGASKIPQKNATIIEGNHGVTL
jgi:hypothetical protein